MSAVNGDQTAALLSEGQPTANSVRVNLGTGAFALTTIPSKTIGSETIRQSSLLFGIADSDEQYTQYYIEGTVNGAGAALAWLKQRYGLESDHFGNIEPAKYLFINTIGGLGSPLWRSDLDPRFVTLSEEKANPDYPQALSAVVESIVFLLQLNIDQMQTIKPNCEYIEISGGLSRNDSINQLLADLSKLPVKRREDSEASARGIAWLAAEQHDHWEQLPCVKTFMPRDDPGLFHRYRCFMSWLDRNL